MVYQTPAHKAAASVRKSIASRRDFQLSASRRMAQARRVIYHVLIVSWHQGIIARALARGGFLPHTEKNLHFYYVE